MKGRVDIRSYLRRRNIAEFIKIRKRKLAEELNIEITVEKIHIAKSNLQIMETFYRNLSRCGFLFLQTLITKHPDSEFKMLAGLDAG